MSRTTTRVDAPPDAVFTVLADGWSYGRWVVGAAAIRAVDDTFPEPGSRFHHRVGVGPLKTSDSTTVEVWDPPRTLVLRARAWPAGVARVSLRVEPVGDGQSRIVLDEDLVDGPARRFDNPVLQALVHLRNAESLRRLGRLVAERGAPASR